MPDKKRNPADASNFLKNISLYHLPDSKLSKDRGVISVIENNIYTSLIVEHKPIWKDFVMIRTVRKSKKAKDYNELYKTN